MTVVFSIFTPIIAKFAVQNKNEACQTELKNFIRLALLIFLPLVAILLCCSEEIVSIFLVRGNFNADTAIVTAQIIPIFGTGLIGIVFYSICGQTLVALNKAKIFAILASATQFLTLVLNVLFYKQYGIIFFAVSWSFAHILSGSVMFLCLPMNKQKIGKDILKMGIMYMIVIGCTFFIYQLVKELGTVRSFLITVTFMLFSTALLLFPLKIDERFVLQKIIIKIFNNVTRN
jgi:peptidoglycan biosynthesis protein MviN/MurJ (putative lipid II flippase)